MIVFVGTPFRSDPDRHLAWAKNLARHIAYSGDTPLVPHLLYPQFLNDHSDLERNIGMRCSRDMLMSCDLALFANDRGLSVGMIDEILFCQSNAIPYMELSESEIVTGRYKNAPL